MTEGTIVALSGLVAAVVGGYQLYTKYKEKTAEQEMSEFKTVLEAWKEFKEEYIEQINELKKENADLRQTVLDLEDLVDELKKKLNEHTRRLNKMDKISKGGTR